MSIPRWCELVEFPGSAVVQRKEMILLDEDDEEEEEQGAEIPAIQNPWAQKDQLIRKITAGTEGRYKIATATTRIYIYICLIIYPLLTSFKKRLSKL